MSCGSSKDRKACSLSWLIPLTYRAQEVHHVLSMAGDKPVKRPVLRKLTRPGGHVPRVFLLLVAGMDYDTAVNKGVRSPVRGSPATAGSRPGHLCEGP